jgi:hypothetical protein
MIKIVIHFGKNPINGGMPLIDSNKEVKDIDMWGEFILLVIVSIEFLYNIMNVIEIISEYIVKYIIENIGL